MPIKWREVFYSVVVILLLWYLIALIVKLPIIPSPLSVLANLWVIFGKDIFPHVIYSLTRIVAGIMISAVIGVPLGYLMGYFQKIDRILSPLLYFAYPVPKIALLPIIMLLMGLGEASKITMIVLIVVFQIIVTTRDAVKNIPDETFRTLLSLGATRPQIFKEIIFPASLGEVLTSSRLALGTALSILFFTETFGTQYGIGYFIMDAWMRVNYLDMYAGIVILSLLGFLIFTIIDWAEHYLCSWR
jgi:NitT/TauT family transport system permease protein